AVPVIVLAEDQGVCAEVARLDEVEPEREVVEERLRAVLPLAGVHEHVVAPLRRDAALAIVDDDPREVLERLPAQVAVEQTQTRRLVPRRGEDDDVFARDRHLILPAVLGATSRTRCPGSSRAGNRCPLPLHTRRRRTPSARGCAPTRSSPSRAPPSAQPRAGSSAAAGSPSSSGPSPVPRGTPDLGTLRAVARARRAAPGPSSRSRPPPPAASTTSGAGTRRCRVARGSGPRSRPGTR